MLLGRFGLTDFTRNVVGVGSVGMPAHVGLFLSADGEPPFLQAKVAGRLGARTVRNDHQPARRSR